MCFSFKLWCYLCTPIQFTHFSNRLHSVHCVAPDNHWRPTAARLWEDGDPCSGWKQGMLTLLIFYHFSINKHETIEYRLPLMTLVEKWLGDRRLWLPMLSFLPRKRLGRQDYGSATWAWLSAATGARLHRSIESDTNMPYIILAQDDFDEWVHEREYSC